MLQNRDAVEQYLWWGLKGGTSLVWYDNWTQLGPLYKHQTEVQTCHSLVDIEVFMQNTGWDYESMQQHISNNIIEHVKSHLDCVRQNEEGDRPWWIKTSTGKFTIKSVWDVLRRRDDVNVHFENIWMKEIPLKISFFGWRVWTNRVPVATVLALWNPNLSEFCCCCVTPEKKTLEHMFLKGEIAMEVWQHYSNAAGLLRP